MKVLLNQEFPGITPAELTIVDDVLRGYSFHLFGSRVGSGFRQASDLDICIHEDNAIPDHTMAGLRFAFQESNLPYKIDLIDWHQVSHEFQEIIQRKGHRRPVPIENWPT